MKTLHTPIKQNSTISQAGVRVVLTFAGIVTAVLCSIALRYDSPTAPGVDSGLPYLLNTSKIVAAGLFGDL